MKRYKAEYRRTGQAGRGVCMADTIPELIAALTGRGYSFESGEKKRLAEWAETSQKRYYGTRLTVDRGEREMTEYTSL